jgi:glutamine cyclotransferase
MKKFHFILFLATLALTACTDDTPKKERSKTKKAPFLLESPANSSKATIGDELIIKLVVEETETLSSVQFFWNDSLILEKAAASGIIKSTLKTDNLPVGFHTFKVVANDKEGAEYIENRTVVLFSDVFPDIKVAKIIREYPHSTTSYTQGLEFWNGRLFEGTGQTGQSRLLEVKLETGEIIRQVDVPDYIFGEGVTILNDEVYQITWEGRKCFVYDVNNFERKREYQYFGEGWGIANDGQHLIMSNGTSEIVFRDPKTFDVVRSIYVFDSNQEYRALNELEYHNGSIYANVYQEDYILQIDPNNGKVLAKIDAVDVVKRGKGNGDVLNGIAFNAKTGNFVLTGKNWPKLFEVQFVEP